MGGHFALSSRSFVLEYFFITPSGAFNFVKETTELGRTLILVTEEAFIKH